MKTLLPLLTIGFIGGASLLSSQPAEEKPIWHSDWPTAQRLAKQVNKPIFAVLACKH